MKTLDDLIADLQRIKAANGVVTWITESTVESVPYLANVTTPLDRPPALRDSGERRVKLVVHLLYDALQLEDAAP